MSLSSVLLGILCVTIVGLFIESVVVFRELKREIHWYLYLSCIALLINNLGFLLELRSASMDSFIAALKFSYLGRTWYAFFMVLFISKLVNIRIPGAVRNLFVVLNGLMYCVILTLESHQLYYTDIFFETRMLFPRLVHGNGPVHTLMMATQILYIVTGLAIILRGYGRKAGKKFHQRLFAVLLAVIVESLFFLIQLIGIPGLTEYFDLTILGYFIGNIFMLVAIFNYDLLGTREIAREYAIDRISEAVIAADNEGIIRYLNAPAKKLYPDLEAEASVLPEGLLLAVNKGENITISDRIYRPEQNELVKDGEVIGTLYALVDETEHFRYMEELQRQRDIADRANEAKSRFLANMSHEIRTPINAVLGMDEMILRESRDGTIRSYAVDIMSAGRNLLSLINDILDLSKVEEGRMEILPVQYEIASLISDLVNMMRERAIKKGLEFDASVDEHIPYLLVGDEVRIRQCVLNLLTNSVKYTQKGFVNLEVSFKEKDDRHIMLKFTVSDTGIGIKKEELEKLFTPYHRAGEKSVRIIEGTGLGMSITEQLLELMGSTLIVESKYGEGSRFSFELEQEVASSVELGYYDRSFASGDGWVRGYRELFRAPEARLLVADDLEVNLSVVVNLLKKTGIMIDTALTGGDAVTLAGTNVYDVILVDDKMRDMDGESVLHAIRELDKNRDTPVVVFTANALSGAREHYLAAGFTDYLSKPVEGLKLEKRLKRLLPAEKVMEVEDSGEGNGEGVIQSRSRLMVVDDEDTCRLVSRIMKDSFEVKSCYSGKGAVDKARQFLPDIILLAVNLPDENGFAVMEDLRRNEVTYDIPVLLITEDEDSVTEENGFKSGAADYIRKPFVPDVLIQRVKRATDLHRYRQYIEKEVARQTGRSRRLTREMMMVLSKTVDTKDHYTDGHSRRVAALCAEIGRRLGKSDEEQVELYETGLLHDIGKIGVHEDIITKNSRLSDDEFAAIREHTIKGYEILKEIKDMPNLAQGARWHHEHFDGKGYPDGIKGFEIPESARITCVADCYDAMTSTRTYSDPKSQEQVRNEILRCRGTWFDPHIADVMLSIIDEDKEYRIKEHAETGVVWKNYDRLWGEVNEAEIPDQDPSLHF